MAKEHPQQQTGQKNPEFSLSFFACPNPNCADFNRFDAGNLSIAERMGKDKAIRWLYCRTCGTRFSEREGSLMQRTKLPEAAVARIIKCLGHGCTVEATADICEVDPRTVERLLEGAGRRAEDFHRLQLERLDKSPEAVQMDELHARVAKESQKKGERHCSIASQKGSRVGSRSVGGGKSLYYRPACRPTYTGVGQRTCGICGHLLRQDPPSAYSYRRAFALSSSHPAGLWTNQASSPTQEGSWSQMQTHSQAPAWAAGGGSQETEGFQRQSFEGYYRCSVRTPQRHQESYSRTGYRLQDKYFSSGTAQWYIARSADTSGQAYSQRLASTLYVAMFLVAAAGFVQLDEGSWLSGGLLPCDGFGVGQACLDVSGVYSLFYACQRPPTTAVGRPTQERPGICIRCL